MNEKRDSERTESPIFLVGFMGAGKTTVGQSLAKELGYEFIDLDDVIAAQTGKSVQQIFLELGEAEFRRLETDAIRSCGNQVRSVVALGGGAYVSKINRELLRGIGKTIWLECTLEVCMRRIRGDQSRPLLGDESAMKQLLDNRRDAYSQADYAINSAELAPEQLAEEIVRLLRG